MGQIKGVIAAGHELTVHAAEEILRDGGNAYDAVVAAHLAACATEPVLSSLAGGGFLLAQGPDRSRIVYDFFAQTPCRCRSYPEVNFFPISADFGETSQEFHIGMGSFATPGTISGLFAIHRDLCSMPMTRLAEPAVRMARDGVVMNSFQSYIFDIVRAVYLAFPETQKRFLRPGSKTDLIGEGDLLRQSELADTLETVAIEGEDLFYRGEIAESVERMSRELGGHITREDFACYKVNRRDPLCFKWRDTDLAINPAPSSGGPLIVFALHLLETVPQGCSSFGSTESLMTLARIQQLTDFARLDTMQSTVSGDPAEKILEPDYIEGWRRQFGKTIHFNRGTTHISVMDRIGNTASLTTSNGEGCGLLVPGTGVMMNNMLGESDLHPGGFHKWPENRRIASMMAPAILNRSDGITFALGSGGSNRLRTAILQVIINIVVHRMPLEKAVSCPRLHCEGEFLSLEVGFDPDQLAPVLSVWPDHKIWSGFNLFFGGTHSVSQGPDGFTGAGDPRRGGSSKVVN